MNARSSSSARYPLCRHRITAQDLVSDGERFGLIPVVLERAAGIEPASLAWKAKVLPLHNARASSHWLNLENVAVKPGMRISLRKCSGRAGNRQSAERSW